MSSIAGGAAQGLRFTARLDDSAGTAEPLTRADHQMLAGIAYAMAMRILSDHADAMDVASESMVTLLARFEPPDNCASYVAQVAKNLAKNKLRGLSRSRLRLQRWQDQRVLRAVEDPDLLLSRLLVRDAVKTLPKRQREAITLCYLQGLDRNTAARRMGVEVASLKTHLKRAFGTLRERLSDESGEQP